MTTTQPSQEVHSTRAAATAGVAVVPPKLARSWLLVPATAPDAFTPDPAAEIDAVIIDLEDAVAASGKKAARERVVEWFANGGNAWVRINDATTEYWADDLAALSSVPGVSGIMLAKTESGFQVDATEDRLPDGTPIVALIESAMGLEAAPEIARSDSTFRLAFGSGDFRRDTGMSDDPMAMAFPRARLVITSRAAKLPGPIDGPTVSANESILERDSAISFSMGMSGRLCLHASQAIPVNRALSPSPADIVWAREVLAELGENGENVKDGSDRPRLAKALEVTAFAAALGLS